MAITYHRIAIPLPIWIQQLMNGGRLGCRRSGSGCESDEHEVSACHGDENICTTTKTVHFYALVSKLTFIIVSPSTINTNDVGGELVGLYGGWESVWSSHKHSAIDGRTRAMVSDVLECTIFSIFNVSPLYRRVHSTIRRREWCQSLGLIVALVDERWETAIPWLRWPVLRGGWCVSLACLLSM